MAKVELNPIFDSVRGKVGDLVLKQYGDSVVMARAGGSGQPVSTAQLAHHRSGFARPPAMANWR